MKRLIKQLNKAGHEYMFTGATAASYYGTPRTTMDIDIIVKTTDQTPHELGQTLKEAGLQTHEDKIRAAQEKDQRRAPTQRAAEDKMENPRLTTARSPQPPT